MGLTLVHLQVPHPPPVYNRAAHAMRPRGRNSYLDSLALADIAFGRLRAAMEARGVWENTAVIVSADHGWRSWLWRNGPEWTAEDEAMPTEGNEAVPFLIKMPGQRAPQVYGKTLHTVVTRALITGILKGELRDASQLPAAIESAGGRR